MNRIQKAIAYILSKAAGFPPWTGGFSTSNYSGQLSRWNGGQIDTGKALDLATLYGCIRLRGGTVGSLPFHVYKNTRKGRVKADDDPTYEILHNTPNAFMTSTEWREAMMLGLDTNGNSYSEISRIGGRLVSLNPLMSDRMVVENKGGVLKYNYYYGDGRNEVLPQEKILHLRNFSFDGIHGLTPIQRTAISLGIVAQDHATSFIKKGAFPSVVFASDAQMPNEETRDVLRDSAEKVHAGEKNAGKMMFTWGGLKPYPLTVSPADAELINLMKLTDVGCCSIYGVPPYMLAIGDKTPTFASAEQFNIQFAQHTIRHIAVKIEQAINKSLFAGTGLYCEFDLAGLMRGDMASQASFISTMVQNGVMTRNEARRLFNLSDMDGGDELTVQSNMLDLSQLQNIMGPKPALTGATS
jgi:HK97 family phage portal protein